MGDLSAHPDSSGLNSRPGANGASGHRYPCATSNLQHLRGACFRQTIQWLTTV
jgi:hypothetical protein